MTARRYPVIIEQSGTGYSAYSPDVSGCVAVGEALRGHAESQGLRSGPDLSIHLESVGVFVIALLHHHSSFPVDMSRKAV